ncbi:HAD family hydrolase [Streptomyces sp. XM4193]|uniref:HAD family hydrolase n=1 Tax=Streptomyces sp. XM4193 TaxID=2929782 RepID=UPI001FFA26BA|nr:HAD family hydrolase [Streptomyces sp. XM4193]MCK1797662.1 HAD family hydrolase [Streptomyces sp. XM4193]
MPIRAVLWDVDDTLFDYTNCDRAAALEHLAAEELLARYRSADAALGHWQEVMRECYSRFAAGELSFAAHRRERARAVARGPLTDTEADQWFGRYVERYEARWALFPDVLPALDTVARTRRQGVLSNSYAANQDRKLRRLGIRDRFEVLVCSAELGCAKPEPEAFEAACLALGLEPDEVAYVGDRLDIDAGAAAEAGLSGIWLDRYGSSREPVPTGVRRIGTLAELPALLGELDDDRRASEALPDGFWARTASAEGVGPVEPSGITAGQPGSRLT